jgi:cell fate (sporulation/competence/biofilm development) regulator YlbF (YheA/YmcA/DUF963 family)
MNISLVIQRFLERHDLSHYMEVARQLDYDMRMTSHHIDWNGNAMMAKEMKRQVQLLIDEINRYIVETTQ